MLDERTRKQLEKILAILKKRQGTFGNALLGLAFSKDEENELRVCFGVINFLRKGEPPFEEITYDYGDFILTKRMIEVPEALAILRSIFENQILKIDGLPEIPLKVNSDNLRFIQSYGHYGYVSSEWPVMFSHLRIDDSTKGTIYNDSLSKRGLPLFPDGTAAIDAFFDLHLPKDWHSLDNNIELRVPDYRARIKNLRLAGNRVSIEVETAEIGQKNILAKFYCKSERQIYTSDDLPLETGRAIFVTDDEPLQVEVHILSALDGESIDLREFDYRYPSRERGVIIENIEVQLLDIISKGENVNVEFKRELNRKRFLQTLVAFANTIGGTIFIGVDNDCSITGFKEDAEARILEWIAELCDPSIEVQVESGFLVQGTPITLVKIPEGINKPYILKDKGIFVRKGSSNRQIKRIELDDIYDAKKQSGSYVY